MKKAIKTGTTIGDIRPTKNKDLLSKEEEIALAKRKDAGDREARNRLVQYNLRLVSSIVWKRWAQMGRTCGSMSQEDLMQAGALGLVTAVDKYNWSQGVRLSTYATYWINDAINAAVSQGTGAMRLPAHRLTLVIAVRTALSTLSESLGRAPDLDEMCAYFGGKVARKDLQEAMALACDAASPISLDAPTGGDSDAEGDAGSVLATCADNPEYEPATVCERRVITETVANAVHKLPEKEQIVIATVFGLDGSPEHGEPTLATAAEKLYQSGYRNKQGKRLSKVAVFEIKQRALKMLKPALQDLGA